MPFARYIWFSLCILLGLVVGLVLGNRLIPIPYDTLPMSSLRADYKTDYVLMVAEAYHTDNQIQTAQNALKRLGTETPVYQVQQALVKAHELNYTPQDLDWMGRLLQDLQAAAPAPTQGGTP